MPSLGYSPLLSVHQRREALCASRETASFCGRNETGRNTYALRKISLVCKNKTPGDKTIIIVGEHYNGPTSFPIFLLLSLARACYHAPSPDRDTNSTYSRVNQLERSIMNSANDEPNSKADREKTSPDHGLKSALGSRNDGMELRVVYGYEQEMPRHRSLANVLFMAISLCSLPYGLATTFVYPLTNGGSVSVIWGWVLVSIVNICVAVSLAEIASRFPVSGGVYYWTFVLSPAKWARPLSYITGWLSLIGNLTVSLAVNFGTAQLLLASINIFLPDYVATRYQTVLTFWALTIWLGVLSVICRKYLTHVEAFNAVWILAGVVTTLVALLVRASSSRGGGLHSAKHVFTSFNNDGTGWPAGWAFCLGLLQGSFVYSATGMIVSMAEETKDPETTIPRSIG